MRRILWVLMLSAVVVGPERADSEPVFAVGYSLASYLEEGGGMAELGLSLSAATRGEGAGLELDLGYHRDSEGLTLNTVTGAVGPRLGGELAPVAPFGHVLFLLRRDSVESFSNTSAGVMVGGGVDLGRGRTRGRLAMDFQIVFEGGENLKVLRSTLGVRF